MQTVWNILEINDEITAPERIVRVLYSSLAELFPKDKTVGG